MYKDINNVCIIGGKEDMQNALAISRPAANNVVVFNTINNDVFNSFIKYLDVAQKSVETYTKAIKSFSRYLQSNNINRPTRQDVLDYKAYLEPTHKPATINLYIIATRLFFEWTEQQGIYPNIAEHIKGKKINREPKKDALTLTQVKEILQNIDTSTQQGLRDYAIVTTAITCGLRTIELSRLTLNDIRQCGDNMVLDVLGKGRDEHEQVILPLATYKVILNYLATRDTKDGTQPVFVSMSNKNKGGQMTTRSISRIIKNTFVDTGYNTDHLTAHSCRHTAVTLALLNGNSVQEVQQMARHKNIATTMIYAHNLEKAQNTCTNNIANAIFD